MKKREGRIKLQGPSEDPGINQRAILQLFEASQERGNDIEYTIKLSLIEIYNDKIRLVHSNVIHRENN